MKSEEPLLCENAAYLKALAFVFGLCLRSKRRRSRTGAVLPHFLLVKNLCVSVLYDLLKAD